MTPYHHYHHHHHHVPRIPYVCGVCGNNAIGVGVIPQCGLCLKTLCAACNIHGLCVNDFARLTPEDQGKIKTLSEQTRSYQKKMAIGPVIAVLCFMLPMMFIPFTLIFSDGLDFFSNIFPLLIGLPFGMCVIMVVIIGISQKNFLKFKAETAAILSPYKQAMPAVMPQPIPAYQQQAVAAIPAEETIVGKICPFCGFSNPHLQGKFCSECGARF